MRKYLVIFILLPLLLNCNSNSTDRKSITHKKTEEILDYDIQSEINLKTSENVYSESSNVAKLVWTKSFKNHKIGYLTIGDSITPSLKRLKQDFIITYDSIEACIGCFDEFEYFYRIVDNSKRLIFTIHPGNEESNIGLIQHVKLYDKTYKSDRGIGIGNSALDLKIKYDINEAYFDYENGLFFFASDFKGSFRFDCCNQEKYHDINLENPTIEIVPDDMVIDMIVIL